MILGDFATGSDYIGAYPNPYRYREQYSNLPISNPRLPEFNLRSGGRVQRSMDQNEQSRTPVSASVGLAEAVKNIFRRAYGGPQVIPEAMKANFAPAIIGSGGSAFKPGVVKSVAIAQLKMPGVPQVFRRAGPGLTPPSPFIYGSKVGVDNAVPVKFRGVPASSAISGSVSVVGDPRRRQIYSGE